MTSGRVLISLLLLWTSVPKSKSQVIPESYVAMAQEQNGSSATGHCNEIISSTCLNTSSGVLFDGIIPTLTGLDGSLWASQLLTIFSNLSNILLEFNFFGTPNFVGVKRVEIVLFNCPEWGISVQSITLQISGSSGGTINPSITSCDSLVRMCIGDLSTSSAQRDLVLGFSLRNPNDWVHIAEVTFHGAGPTCPNDTVITASTTTTITASIKTSLPPATLAELTTHPDTTVGNTDTTVNKPIPPQGATTSLPSTRLAELTSRPETVDNKQCPSCSTSTIPASVITAIAQLYWPQSSFGADCSLQVPP